jgi:hypothetical protein
LSQDQLLQVGEIALFEGRRFSKLVEDRQKVVE